MKQNSLAQLKFVVVASLISVSLIGANAQAGETPVRLADGNEVVANIQNADASKSQNGEVFVLLNGLVYEMNRWDNVANLLAAEGHTVIRYAYSAQPANLRRLAAGDEPRFFQKGLDPEKMASELYMLLDAYGVQKPVHVVGLSYGASVAVAFAERFPSRVADTTFVSPLVVPTDTYDSTGDGLRTWLSAIRFWENSPCQIYGMWNPWLCQAQDYWYDAFYKSIYESYLLKSVTNIPADVEPTIYKKSLFHLIRATRDFDLKARIAKLQNVSMFVASDDDAPLRKDQDRAWKEAHATQKRLYVKFNGAHHALPDEAPVRLVEFLLKATSGAPEYSQGAMLETSADQ